MATKKKLLQAAAGSAGGAGLDITDVFSTYLWAGNNTGQTIVNNIDLSGEGGLVWEKVRNQSYPGGLYDTERGVLNQLRPDNTDATNLRTGSITAFNSDGFSIGNDTFQTNGTGNNYASWTFRKAPKFFDVVTWIGNGVDGRAINHNLGSVPGMIIVKDYSNTGENWTVYHRGIDVNGDNAPETDGIYLNTTGAAGDESGFWNDTAPTSTQFTVGVNLNGSAGGGANYVAYLFAHNNSDGDFGPDADQDVIKCGSYTGAGTTDVDVNLGFEPQWLLIKSSSAASTQWLMLDNMRGTVTGGNDSRLFANLSNSENASTDYLEFTSTGFRITGSSGDVATNGAAYIYMAIRRGPLAEPTSGTDVFATGVVQNNTGRTLTNPLGHPSDWAFTRTSSGGDWIVQSRLTGSADLKFNSTAAEVNNKGYGFANNTNYEADGTAAIGAYGWNFRRAPGYFDVVAYTGTGAAQTINHNLGAIPEMIWLKRRDAANFEWIVYHKGLNGGTSPEDYVLYLNASNAEADVAYWDDTAPTSTTFRVSGFGQTGSNGGTYIAYLFATVAGVSKVGSYTGNGSSSGPTVDCGFSGSPRFVLIKKATGGTGSWYVFDSERGIVAGAESQLYLNNTAAEQTATDQIDPTSSGFQIVINSGGLNTNGETYIFYAIA